MARNHGRILTSIWDDDDWLALTGNAQRLYLLMLSQSNMNQAGVLPLQKTRWKARCSDWTAKHINAALTELAEARFVVVDEGTEEVLVRSYIRRDGVWKQPNILRAALSDAQAVLSPRIKAELRTELSRLPATDPRKGVSDALEQARRVASGLPDIPREPKGKAKGSTLLLTDDLEPQGVGEGAGVGASSVGLVVEKRSGTESAPTFDDFWSVYPIKQGKSEARDAWVKAIRRASPAQIIAGAQRYRDDPNRDPTKTKYGQGWLNHDRWDDPPLPGPAGSSPELSEVARIDAVLGPDRWQFPPMPPSLDRDDDAALASWREWVRAEHVAERRAEYERRQRPAS